MYDIDTPIFIESCYNSTVEECVAYPSKSRISNVSISNVVGNSTGLKGDVVADLR